MGVRCAKQRLRPYGMFADSAMQTSEITFFITFFHDVNLANYKPFKLSFKSLRVSTAVYL